MRKISLLVTFLIFLFASPVHAATTWCADALNGNDTNTGVAGGTLPNLTNCKQSIEAACALLTTGDTLEIASGYYHDPTYANTALDMCPFPVAAANVTITSYGPNILGPDPASDASASAVLDGAECVGKHRGVCSTAKTAINTWTLVSGSIYKTPLAAYPFWVYANNIQGWPDGVGGLKSAAGITSVVDSVTNPSQLAIWTGSHVYAANSDVQNGVYPAEWWHTTAGGTSGSTPPTCLPSTSSCTAGTTTFTDNTVTWTLEGVAHATIGPMIAGSWYSDFQFLYVWMPDSSNPNANVVEAADKLYPIHVNVNGTGDNGLNVNHLGFIRFGAGPLIFDTAASGNCIANMVFDRDWLQQTGTSNIDVGMFLNGFRLTGSDATCNPAYQITHTYMANCGEHGGCLTGQVVGGSTFAHNNYGPNNHGGVNLTQNGSTNPGANVSILDSYCHDQMKSQNASVATDSVSCFYAQNTTGLIVKGTKSTRVLDAGCGGGGQCACALFAGTTGTQFINNTCSGAQNMIAEASGFPNTGLVIRNDLCDNMVPELSSGVCVNALAAADIAAANNNILPGTNVATINGVLTNFATWQADGFDPNGINTAATFWRTAWPFFLAPESRGIGAGDASQGVGQNIGAEQNTAVGNMGEPLPLQSQIGQNGY